MEEYIKKDHGTDDGVSGKFVMEMMLLLARLVGAILGVVVIVTGLKLAVKVFVLLYDGIFTPQLVADPLAAWAEAVGGSQLDIIVQGSTLHGAEVVSLAALGFCIVMMISISLGLVKAGGKVLYWVFPERRAKKPPTSLKSRNAPPPPITHLS